MPHKVGHALELWQESRRPITAWLAQAGDDLTDLRPSDLGEPMTAGEVVRIQLTSRPITAPKSRSSVTCTSDTKPESAVPEPAPNT